MDDKKKIGFQYPKQVKAPAPSTPAPSTPAPSTPAPSTNVSAKVSGSVDSLFTGLINVVGQIIGYITTGAVEISVIALDALLSSGNRGFQALAGTAASLGYYASLRYTWYLMASMDPHTGLAVYLGLVIEFSKIVLSYLGWGRPGGTKYVKALAIVGIAMSIFATMAYSKNINNQIRIDTAKNTDKYKAQQAQRDSLLDELETINAAIAAKEQTASDTRAGADAAATKVSTIDVDVKANATAAKKAKDDQADAIQAALDSKLASYSPAWIAKNTSTVSKWKEQARTDIAALRTAGVNVYKDMTQAKDYDTAKNEVLSSATALEGQAKDLRSRKDNILAKLSESESTANDTERYTSGYLAVFEVPATKEEGIELLVNLFFAVFLELFAASMVKAYKDFSIETSSLFGVATNFADKLRNTANKLRTAPNTGLVTATYEQGAGRSEQGAGRSEQGAGRSEQGAGRLGVGYSDWVEDTKPLVVKTATLSAAQVTAAQGAAAQGAAAQGAAAQGAVTHGVTKLGNVDLAVVQRYASHIISNATTSKSGELVAPGIRATAAAIKISPETAKKAHWYLVQHGKVRVDDKAKRTYLPQ